jgi:hypothetical protein
LPRRREQQVARERADQLVEADRVAPEKVAHDHHHREPEKQRGRKVVRDDGRRRQRRRHRIERDRERDRRQREHHGQPPFPALLEDDQQDGDGDCSHEQIVGKARSRECWQAWPSPLLRHCERRRDGRVRRPGSSPEARRFISRREL